MPGERIGEEIRLDKFLQVTRLVKKRDHTRELAGDGRLLVNGLAAKPSRHVRIGDCITIRFWRKLVALRILECPRGSVSRKDAHRYYEILEERMVEEEFPGLPR